MSAVTVTPPGPALEAKILKLPKWARDHIRDLTEQIEDLEAAAEAARADQSYDDLMADLWQQIAADRARRGDPAGAARARRAAGCIKNGSTI